MKPVRIAPPAVEEFTEAVSWYEGRRVGLGAEFYDAVVHTVSVLRKHPEIGIGVEGPHPHRQFLVDGFPYKVVYRERPDDAVHVIGPRPEPRLAEPASLEHFRLVLRHIFVGRRFKRAMRLSTRPSAALRP